MQEGSYFYSVSVSSSLAPVSSPSSPLLFLFSFSSLLFPSFFLPSFPFQSSLYPIVTIPPRLFPSFRLFDFFLEPILLYHTLFLLLSPFLIPFSPSPILLIPTSLASLASLLSPLSHFLFSPPFLPLS